MKRYISIMIMGAVFAVSLCSCAEETANTPKAEQEQATDTTTEQTEEPVYEEPTEDVTEPLTEEGVEVVQVTKDYITALEKFDLDAIAGFYNPNRTSTTNIYDSLTKIHRNACDSGISPDDYKAIWESTEIYDDLTFTFDDYATCKIDGDTAKVEIDYTVKCYEYRSQNEYYVRFKFPMIKVNDKWYLSGDPNYDDSYCTYAGTDLDDDSIKVDQAYYCAPDIDLIINNCYSDIQSNDIEKYNAESAELITVADAVEVYGYADCFDTLGNDKYGCNPYWYKAGGYSVFLDLDGHDILNFDDVYSDDEVVPLSENKMPSDSVYVVDLFR